MKKQGKRCVHIDSAAIMGIVRAIFSTNLMHLVNLHKCNFSHFTVFRLCQQKVWLFLLKNWFTLWEKSTVKINLPIFKDISMYASVLGTIAQRYNQCNSQWSGLLSEMASSIILNSDALEKIYVQKKSWKTQHRLIKVWYRKHT